MCLTVTALDLQSAFLCAGCATSVLVTSAGMGEMVMQLLVGSVSVMNIPLKWGKGLTLIGVILLFPPRSFRLKVATVSRCAE